jgi:hypothetical protein
MAVMASSSVITNSGGSVEEEEVHETTSKAVAMIGSLCLMSRSYGKSDHNVGPGCSKLRRTCQRSIGYG